MKQQVEILIFSDVDYTNEDINQFMKQDKEYSPKDYSSFLHKISYLNKELVKSANINLEVLSGQERMESEFSILMF